MKKLSAKETVLLSIAFFSMFFGSGNLIFPPRMGFQAGNTSMIALLGFSISAIISMNVRAKGIKDEKSVISSTISAGWIAGFFLFAIYTGMTLVGALSAGLFQNANNGANVLSNIVYHLFGTYGLIALAIIYVLSCLTTCIGLLCSCSEFFSSISKIAYKKWITLFTIISCVVSIFRLDQILTISAPILTTIYPVAMVLVILGLLKDKMQRYPNTYPVTIYSVTIISIIYSLNSINIHIPFITNFILSFPPNKDLCWLIPSIIAFMIGMVTSKKKMH